MVKKVMQQNADGDFEAGSEGTATGNLPAAPGSRMQAESPPMPANVAQVLRDQLSAMGYARIASVATPTLVMKRANQAMALMFREEMHVSDYVDPDDTKKEPATVAIVADITTGAEYQFLVPAVVRSNLVKHYPKRDENGNALIPPEFANKRDAKDRVIESAESQLLQWFNEQPGKWGYVGRQFIITNVGKRPGKLYHDFAVEEIGIPAAVTG